MSDKSLEGLKINILGDSIPYGALHLLYQDVLREKKYENNQNH